MKKKISFFLLLILVNLAAEAQQEPLFSNYMFARTITNPGFVGSEKTINALFCNRIAFAGFEGKPVTSVFGVEAPFEMFGLKSGFGMMVMNDKIGSQEDISVDMTYSYHHTLKAGRLGFGLRCSFNDYTIDPSNGEWVYPDQNGGSGDPLIPDSKFHKMVFGINLGAYFETPKYYIGFSATKLNRGVIFDPADEQEIVISYYVPHYYLTGAYNIELPDPLFDLQPSFVLRTDLAGYSLDLNGTIFYKQKYRAGFGLRVSQSNIASLTLLGGVELLSGLNIGYALDVNTSYMVFNSATSHEVILTYSFNIDTKRDKKYKSVRYL
jgi:type IX secretion system PorP/SprF family membrane protein